MRSKRSQIDFDDFLFEFKSKRRTQITIAQKMNKDDDENNDDNDDKEKKEKRNKKKMMMMKFYQI